MKMVLLLQKGLCMNLLPVNYQQPLPSFKGLWGRTHFQTSNYSRGHCVIETYDYHPYADESSEAVRNIIDSRSEHRWRSETEQTVFYKSMVNIKDKLPFTQKEFDLYIELKVKKQNEICSKVEKGLAEAKLYKYLNNIFKYFLCKFCYSAKKMMLRAF